MSANSGESQPLQSLDEWEDFVEGRYPQPAEGFTPHQNAAAFRDYDNTARSTVREFYRLNHRHQCVDFVRAKRDQYLGRTRETMAI